MPVNIQRYKIIPINQIDRRGKSFGFLNQCYEV